MKRTLIILGVLFVVIKSSSSFSQEKVKLLIEGTTVNNTETGIWGGVYIERSVPTSLTYRNNSITSVNVSSYMLQAGDDELNSDHNNLDGEIITGNKLVWNGTNISGTITHGIFTGYNINAVVKYNYLNKVPMAIIRKSNGMTNTSGGVAYNIVNRTGATALAIKGMNGVLVYNNTFFSDEVVYTAPDKPGTWRGLVDIYTNTDITPNGSSSGTKIKNNIFYTKFQIYNIMIYDDACLSGFESDYNVFYCEAGTPMFNYLGTAKTFAQWQALGYDTHSIVLNPNFNNFTDFVPAVRLDYGTNLGSTWQTGLSTTAVWQVGSSPATTDQNGIWQVGARIYNAQEFNEINPESINLYPNPNTGIFNIEISDLFKDKSRKISVIALSGEKVYEDTLATKELTRHLNLSQLASGIYILVISDKEIITTRKFVKK